MAHITLRQAVMLVNQTPLDKDGDKDDLMKAAEAYGATEPHALGGMDEAVDRFIRENRVLAAQIPKIDDIRETLDETNEDHQRKVVISMLNDWIENNQEKYPKGIEVKSLQRA